MGMARQQPIALSIVIPAYNEESRLPESFSRLKAYLEKKPYATEVIVVDDGSTDGTRQVVEQWQALWPALRLIEGTHQGKGGAVRAGIRAAQGAYIALADADFSMPAEEFDRFSTARLGAYDVAIGSREAPGSERIGEPLYRHILGRVFNGVVRLLLLPGIQDTQCGFKYLRREVALDLCEYQTITGWGFDVELLYVARRRGYAIAEVPITWYYMPGSRVSPIRDTFTMLGDVLRIRWQSLWGQYQQQCIEPRLVAVPVGDDELPRKDDC